MTHSREVISLQSASRTLERPVRISASNLYRTYEEGAAAKGELRVQVPVPVRGAGGWHVVVLDLRKLAADYSRDGLRHDHVRAVTVCAALSIRNMFTSDCKFSLLGMPPEMALSMKPEVAAEVTAQWLPEEPVDVSFEPPHPASTARKAGAAQPSTATGRLSYRLQTLLETDRGLPLTPGAREAAHPLSVPMTGTRTLGDAFSEQGDRERSFLSDIEQLEEAAADRSFAATTPGGSAPASPLRSPLRSGAAPRGFPGSSAVTRWQEPEPLASKIDSIGPLTTPCSAALKHIVGYSGDSAPSARRLLIADPLADQGKTGPDRELVSTSHHLILATKMGTKRPVGGAPAQRVFRGHARRVNCLALSGDCRVMASAEEPSHLGVPTLRVWDFATGECLCILGMREADRPVHVTSVDLSKDGTRLVALGASNVEETVLCMWDLSPVTAHYAVARGKGSLGADAAPSAPAPAPRLLARQVVDADARVARICPFQEDEVVVGGRNSLRVHRLYKGQEFRGMSVALAPKDEGLLTELARSALVPNTFTAIAFDENEPDPSIGVAAYVATVTGHVFKVDVAQRRLISIYHLHNGAINAIDIRGGLCATGGDDRVVRLWPLDFNDFLMEAEHEAGVSDLAFGPDALSVVVGTEDACIGQLSVPDRSYDMAMRAHSAAVMDVAASADLSRCVSVSADGTIRSWLLPGLVQDGEFVADANDTPLSVDLVFMDLEASSAATNSPLLPLAGPRQGGANGAWVAAVGFSSGVVRIFELQRNLLITETRQHRAPVNRVQFTPGGRWLFTADAQGALCVYQPHKGFMPLKYLNAGMGVTLAARAPEAAQGHDAGFAGALLSRFPLAVSRDGSLMSCVVSDRDAHPCLVLFSLVGGALRALFKVDLWSPIEEKGPRELLVGGRSMPPPPPRASPVNTMSFNGQGTAVILGRSDGSIERYDAASGALLARAVHPLGTLRRCRRSPTQSLIGCTHLRVLVSIYSIRFAPTFPPSIRAGPQSMGCSSLTTDLWDRLLVTAGNMGDVRLWDARTLAHQAVVSVTPDGASSATLLVDPFDASGAASVLIGTADGSLQVWAVEAGAALAAGADPLRSALLVNRALAVEAGMTGPAALPACVTLSDGSAPSGDTSLGAQPELQALYGGSLVAGAGAQSCWSETRGALAYSAGRLLVVEEFFRNPLVALPAAEHAALHLHRVQRCLPCGEDVTCVAWGRDGSLLAVGLTSGTCQVWASAAPSAPWRLRATLRQPSVPTASAAALPVDTVLLDTSCTWLIACSGGGVLSVFDLVSGSCPLTINSKTHPRQLTGLKGAQFIEPCPTPLTPRASLSFIAHGAAGAALFTLDPAYHLAVWPLWSLGVCVAKGLVVPEAEPADRAAHLDERSPHVEVAEVRVERDKGTLGVRLVTASGVEARVLLPDSAHPEPRVASIRPHDVSTGPFTLIPVPQRALFESVLGRAVTWAEMRGRRAIVGCADGACHLVDLDALDARRAREKATTKKRWAAPGAREAEEEATAAAAADQENTSLIGGPAVKTDAVPSVALLGPLASRVVCVSAPSGQDRGYVVIVDEDGRCSAVACSPSGALAPLMDLTAAVGEGPYGKEGHARTKDPATQAVVLGGPSLVGMVRRSGALEALNLEYLAGSAEYEVSLHEGGEVRALGTLEWAPQAAAPSRAAVVAQDPEDDEASPSFMHRYFVTVDAQGTIVFTVASKGVQRGTIRVGRTVRTARFLPLGGQGSLLLMHTLAPEDPLAPAVGDGDASGWIDASLSPRTAGHVVERLELWRLAWDEAEDEPRGAQLAVFTLPEGTVISDLCLLGAPNVRVSFIDASLGAAVYWIVPAAPEASYAGPGTAAQPAVTYMQPASGKELTALALSAGSPARGPRLVLGHSDGTIVGVDEAAMSQLCQTQGSDVIALPTGCSACSVGDRVETICITGPSGAQAIVAAGRALGLISIGTDPAAAAGT